MGSATKTDVEVEVLDVLGFVATSDVTAYEGCEDAEFTFSLPIELPNDFTLQYTVTGTATMGADFNTVPSSITVPAGQISATLPINTLLDGNTEGLENIILTIIPASYDDTATCPHVFIASVDIADVLPLEIAAIGDTSVCNFSVPLSSLASGGFGALSYVWNKSAGVGPGVYVKPTQTTTYTVSVVDACQSGVAYDSVMVEVDCEYLFFAPNAFTPNGDGLNDIFNGRWKGMKTYKMQIFNRWGDLIFETDDRRLGWNGIANEGKKLAEQEVYVYVFETTDFLDIPHTYVGKVLIVQ
ncbi:MAG: gliding motility-associated C-terminal domain-containing protein [Flavobacteriales bacterium]|nr:gliding motility-associated C-terminal domain-containing protein [Flavobacteriales bacterium]